MKSLVLLEKQFKFSRMVVELLNYAHTKGYEITLGEAYRSPHEAARLAKDGKGIRNSLHTQRLAIDLNLFSNGRWLKYTDDHRVLGEYWESIGGSWGGRFGDGNHYSLEYDGRT